MTGYLFGVIGNPIKHSLSPWIHQQFMNKSSVAGIYRPYEIPENKLQESVETFKRMKMDGFNVTIPYKEKMLQLVDEIDQSAKAIGAINTVVYQDGKWVGYNTDGRGYIRSLKNAYPHLFHNPNDKKVLVIGAGGAARGIYHALNENEFTTIDIANRTYKRAEGLLSMKNQNIKTHIFSLQEAESQLDEYDLIVQTTNIGMTPNSSMMPIELQNIRNNTIVSDIIYNPIETAFLTNAKQYGAKIHHGHGMLLYQAAYSFELWTGKTIDPQSLLQQLEQKLKGGSPC